MSDPKTFLIIGANRGIGLAFVGAVLAKQPTATVIATVRVTSSASDLLALQKTYASRLEIVTMDVGDEASVKAAAEEVGALPVVKEHGLDMLVLNAGVSSGLYDTALEIKNADLDANLRVNLYGPMYCVNHFLPLIRAGQFKRIAYCSSATGSNTLSFNAARPGDLASYGVSRAAAGSYFVRLAGELKGEGVHVALYTPGIVDTEQAKDWNVPGFTKLTTAEAANLWLEQHVVAPPKPTGSFFNEKGETIPW